MSRPPKEINWKIVDNMLEAGCNGMQIASHFDMHHDTFYQRVQDEFGASFTAYSSLKRQKGEASLILAQHMKALGITKLGDNTLLMFLGRVRLNQDEHKDITIAPNDNLMNFADAYIKAEAQRLELANKLQLLEEKLNALSSQS